MANPRAIAAIGLVVAAAACSHDATGTKDALIVSVQPNGLPTATIVDAPNGPRIDCGFTLSAEARGHGTALWDATKVLLYAGPNRSAPIDSITPDKPSDALSGGLGTGYINAGQTQQGKWTLSYAAPFEATINLQYTVDGRPPATASTHVACGPSLQNAVAPSITEVSVQTQPALGLRPGDPVVITYHEVDGSGVWKTVIDLSGAFTGEQVMSEHLATSVDRTLTVTVPTIGSIGEPLRIAVHAYDAALHETRMTNIVTAATFVGSVIPTEAGARN